MARKQSAKRKAKPSTHPAPVTSARQDAVIRAEAEYQKIHRDLQARIGALKQAGDDDAATRLAVKEWRGIPDEAEKLRQTVLRFATEANLIEAAPSRGITQILPLDHPDHPIKKLPAAISIKHIAASWLLSKLDAVATSILLRYCRTRNMNTDAFEPGAEIDNREPYADRVLMELDITANGKRSRKGRRRKKRTKAQAMQMVRDAITAKRKSDGRDVPKDVIVKHAGIRKADCLKILTTLQKRGEYNPD